MWIWIRWVHDDICDIDALQRVALSVGGCRYVGNVAAQRLNGSGVADPSDPPTPLIAHRLFCHTCDVLNSTFRVVMLGMCCSALAHVPMVLALTLRSTMQSPTNQAILMLSTDWELL
jgi:hypothetical protein